MASRSLSGGLVVDHRDAAGVGAARLHAEQSVAELSGAVDAGRHDHHALHVQRLVQRRHLLGRRQSPACRRGPRRTGISRDRRGYGYGSRRRRPARRSSPPWRAAPPWRKRCGFSWQLPRQWKQAERRVVSASIVPPWFSYSVMRRVGKVTGRERVRWRAHHSVSVSRSRWWARREERLCPPYEFLLAPRNGGP